MKTYEVIFEASVALLAGKLLRGVESQRSGSESWGVIDCDMALGAFDARSDAWCGSDGIPHRYTREEAELRARRLSGSSHDGTAYCALEIPERPRVVMAGRRCSVTGEALDFECVDWTNGPADVVTSGSAFDVAQAFVALMGDRLTYAAIYAEESATTAAE